jgi:imidazolonepropionase-like amidohydrolase
VTRVFLVLAVLGQGASGAAPQEETVAITNVRILTVTKGEIDSGTIVIRGEKIAQVGKEVKPPADARVVDGRGLTAFPGIVQPVSRLGAAEALGGGGSSTPHHTALDEVNPTLDLFGQIPRTGVTTFAVFPSGGAVAGLGVALKPAGFTRESMVFEKAAFLRLNMQSNTQTKEAIRSAFDGARKAIEAEKKPAAPAPAASAPGPAKPAAPAAPAAPPPPPPKPSEQMLVLMRALRGELPVLVSVMGPADVLHLDQVMGGFPDYKPRLAWVAPADVYKAADALGARKARVILRPDLTFLPQTRDRVNPAADLARAGAVVAFSPGADSPETLEGYLARVGEMVKHGLPREAALRAVTIAAAEAVGLEKRVGSIEAGKDADLLLFEGEPLSIGARLRRVFINGKEAYVGD